MSSNGLGRRGLYELPATLVGDLDEFAQKAAQFENGSLSAERFRAFRVPQGVYEQREAGSYMLRVRCAGGVVLPEQMRTLADVCEKYANGVLHVTTRQDIQLHQVAVANIHPALVELFAAGLSTKGGGGNTVRNVTACHDSGVCPDEVYDVSPHALALTEFLLPDRRSYELPRKYKIAFSGCAKDCAAATVNDVGFIAKTRNGVEGFSVHVAGGMGAKSRVADLLEEFVPASEIHLVAEAVKRLFDNRGNRRNKHKARLRFLMEEIGFETFVRLYRKELDELRAASTPPLAVPVSRGRRATTKAVPGSAFMPDGFEQWMQHNVSPQKQTDYFVVRVLLALGDIEANTMRVLADIVAACGEGVLRTTQSQNIAIRWVQRGELPQLYTKLKDAGLARDDSAVLGDIVACAGASTCKLGICLSRGLARAIAGKLSEGDSDWQQNGNPGINISGCPNSCGRHPVADIGLFGAARRVGGKLVPHYVLQFGGHLQEGETTLAAGKLTIPARNVPAFLGDFLSAYARSPHRGDFRKFVETAGRKTAEVYYTKYKSVPEFQDDKNYYFDWDADTLFSLAGRGPGECGAGVFDLIEVDLASAREALGDGKHYAAATLAARALLVTRGEQADDHGAAFTLFRKHFIAQEAVSAFSDLIDEGQRCSVAVDPETAFQASSDTVGDFVEAVAGLYDSMDASLRLVPQGDDGVVAQGADPTPSGSPATADVSHDFRGVVCPLNYVKTKLALDQMQTGQTLAVLLDEEGSRNVPASAGEDGHKVLSVVQTGNHWRVLISKGDEG